MFKVNNRNSRPTSLTRSLTAAESFKKLSRDTQAHAEHENLSTCTYKKSKILLTWKKSLEEYLRNSIPLQPFLKSPLLHHFTSRVALTQDPFEAYWKTA